MFSLSAIPYVAAVAAGLTGIAVLLQEKRGATQWAFLAGMLMLGTESLATAFSLDSIDPTGPFERVTQWEQWIYVAKAAVPCFWLAFALTYARGTAQSALRRARPMLLGAFFVPVAWALFWRPNLVQFRQTQVEHLGATGSEVAIGTLDLGPAGVALTIFFLCAGILILMNLERTFRASVGTMRWRIKFMVLGLGVIFGVRAFTDSQTLLFTSINPWYQVLNSGALIAGCLLITRSVFRTGHFEVNVYPSQTVLQNSLTVFLAGLYLVIVGAIAKKVHTHLGQSALVITAFLVLVALVLLSLVLLSDRVRLRTRQFISRHFQRPLHDYRTVWHSFTQASARRVHQEELCSAIVKLVSEVFQALSVSIWTVDESREKLLFAASTSLSQNKAGQIELDRSDAREVIQALTHAPEPVNIDTSREIWAAALRRTHPEQFRGGGCRFCIPMMTGDELVGILTVGDRVGGLDFSLQDLDLLKSISDQAAANLLNSQLSARLSQAKQLEAFQAMSAFFVHDLKNTASTLSLMLQNLPVHYDDPAFRDDALRAISKTVNNINDLISRLSVLRHELAIQAVDCDLNVLVDDFLKHQRAPSGVELVKELHPLPKLRLDPQQIEKVLTNVLLNAKESLPGVGRISVQTDRRQDWAILTVADNGCGMTPEFLRNNLFRPFQTTKKRGIGIGMFHCKMIVEAHGGRLEVESAPGKGTSFHVLLPIESRN